LVSGSDQARDSAALTRATSTAVMAATGAPAPLPVSPTRLPK
jgi:hypothetical protein